MVNIHFPTSTILSFYRRSCLQVILLYMLYQLGYFQLQAGAYQNTKYKWLKEQRLCLLLQCSNNCSSVALYSRSLFLTHAKSAEGSGSCPQQLTFFRHWLIIPGRLNLGSSANVHVPMITAVGKSGWSQSLNTKHALRSHIISSHRAMLWRRKVLCCWGPEVEKNKTFATRGNRYSQGLIFLSIRKSGGRQSHGFFRDLAIIEDSGTSCLPNLASLIFRDIVLSQMTRAAPECHILSCQYPKAGRER